MLSLVGGVAYDSARRPTAGHPSVAAPAGPPYAHRNRLATTGNAAMSKRLHFLVPDLFCCQTVVAELRAWGIPEHHIHVVANHTTPLQGLPEADLRHTSDLHHGLRLGIGVGGIAGLLGGLLAVSFPPAGLVLGGGAVLFTTLAGAGAAALVSGLVAIDMPNHTLSAYEEAILSGQLLVVVEVPRAEAVAVAAAIRGCCPGLEIDMALPPPSATPPQP